MIDLAAIRARDANSYPTPRIVNDSYLQQSQRDRHALLLAYDALREAAGKVTCWRCEGYGELKSPYEEGAGMDDAEPCPDCADLRRLLGDGSHG